MPFTPTFGFRSRSLLAVALLFTPLLILGQPGWAAAGIPYRTIELTGIYADTIADALYFCGESSVNNDFNFGDQAISVYHNGQWDTLGIFDNRPTALIRWHDTLVAGGGFSNIDGMPIGSAAYYDGTDWHPFGTFTEAGIYRLKIIAGELYAIGAFLEADGHLCNGLARRNGGQWVNVGTFDVYSTTNIQDLVLWNEQLFATGVIRFSNGLPRDVAYFDGAEWHPLGPGITGTFSAGRSLAVYQNELYVGGSIDINAGNVGHGVMKWDGAQYHPVGSGLQGTCDSYACPSGALDMKVRDGLLFVAGTFSYAGHQEAPGVATWNGSQWCGLAGDLRKPVNAIEFFHDTLFAAPFHEAEGVDVNCGARYIWNTYDVTCSTIIDERGSGTKTSLVISPNPVTDELNIDLSDEGVHQLRVTDALGRCVLQRTFSRTLQLNVRVLCPGSYTIGVFDTSDDLQRFSRIVKQ